MLVHLTSANSSAQAQDGTEISSGVPSLPESMRISFTADGQTWMHMIRAWEITPASSGSHEKPLGCRGHLRWS